MTCPRSQPNECSWSQELRFFFFLNDLFIYFWLCWVFVAVRGFLVAVSGGSSLLGSAWASLAAEHGL